MQSPCQISQSEDRLKRDIYKKFQFLIFYFWVSGRTRVDREKLRGLTVLTVLSSDCDFNRQTKFLKAFIDFGVLNIDT